MLVLSRRESERLVLPTLGITIEVVGVQGKKTRLGIDAPPDVPILRSELADLKGIDFTPDGTTANRKCSRLATAVRSTVGSTAEILNRLHAGLEGNESAQQLVLDAFHELRALDQTVGETLEEIDRRPPHALLIDTDANERELLASCLRLSGFEVVIASDAEDAIGYLSMHSRPDVALLDASRVDAEDVERLRSTEACQDIKLIGLGERQPGVDQAFARPINAEQLVDALTRELTVVAV